MNDSTARYVFEAVPLTKFLSKMSESCPSVTEVPVRAFLMFPSTYLCEQGFLTMFCMKTKFHAHLCFIQNCSLNRGPGFEQESSALTWFEVVSQIPVCFPTTNRDPVLSSIKCVTELTVTECCFLYNSMMGYPADHFSILSMRGEKGWELLN